MIPISVCPKCRDYIHYVAYHWVRVWHSNNTYTDYHKACWGEEKQIRAERRRRIELYNRAKSRASLTIGTPNYSPVKAELTVEREF
jgi:hypothetical protein